MSAETIERDDPTFVYDLKESQEYVWLVARWLGERGHTIAVPPLHIRPDASRMDEFSDDGDLLISLRVEVKRRPSMEFTKISDFPYRSVIVDVAHAWDAAKPKPYAYVILNGKATHAIIVPGHTHKAWNRVTKPDRAKRRDRSFYECPIEMCSFVSLQDAARPPDEVVGCDHSWIHSTHPDKPSTLVCHRCGMRGDEDGCSDSTKSR